MQIKIKSSHDICLRFNKHIKKFVLFIFYTKFVIIILVVVKNLSYLFKNNIYYEVFF